MGHHKEYYRAKRHIYKRSAEKQGHKGNGSIYLNLSAIIATLLNIWAICVKAASSRWIFSSKTLYSFVSVLFVVNKTTWCRFKTWYTKNIQHSMFNVRRSTFTWLCLLLSYLGSFSYSAFGQTVCAKIKLVIKQEVTLERQAFEAELTVANGLLIPLENFQVTVWARELGSSQFLTLETIDGLEFFSNVNPSEVFFFSPQDETEPIVIAAGGEKTFTYLLIPTQEAALNTEGTNYELGADVSYTSGGENTALSVEPDIILVKPQPSISLEYFLPKSVIADDPNTSIVEFAKPFDLGLRVVNSGFGAAENLQVKSFQPVIEENDQGLLIDFRILSSQVNGSESAPSLTVNFGQLLSGQAETASWQMLSTLFGRFLEAKASFTHADELGGSITSLIDEAKVYRLVGSVQANADGIPDFLSVGSGSTGGQVNGKARIEPEDFALELRTAAFLNLHPSGLQGDGSAGTIDKLNVANFSGYLAPTSVINDRLKVQIENPPQGGGTSYSFVRIEDPRKNNFEIRSVVRSDGIVLNPANYGLSTEIKEDANGGIDGFEYFVDIFDIGNAGGTLDYTIFYGAAIARNQAPYIVPLPDLTLRDGDSLELTIEAFDPNSDAVTLSVLGGNLPSGSSFVDNGDDTATLTWPSARTGLVPLTVIASDGFLSTTDTIYITVLDADDGLAEWLESYGLSVDTITLESDPDGDDFSTLLEYVLNLNPRQGSLQDLPRVLTETLGNDTFLVLECDVLNSVWDYQDDTDPLIELKVLVSSDSTQDPANWDLLSVAPVASPSPIPGMTRLRWRDVTSLTNFPQGRFIRLQAVYDDSHLAP